MLAEPTERGAGSSVARTLGSKSSSWIDPSTRITVLMPVSTSREIDLIAALEELSGLAGSRRCGAIGSAAAGCMAAMAVAAAGSRSLTLAVPPACPLAGFADTLAFGGLHSLLTLAGRLLFRDDLL